MSTNPPKKFYTYTVRDFYKEYSKACTKSKRYKKRDYHKYKAFLYDVFGEIFKKIINDAWHFVLPYSLGEFYIKLSKHNVGERTYCPHASRRKGEDVYVFNNHTLRKTFKFYWDKSYVRYPTVKYYKFKIIRGVRARERGVGKEALSDHWFSTKNIPTPYNHPIKRLEDLNE